MRTSASRAFQIGRKAREAARNLIFCTESAKRSSKVPWRARSGTTRASAEEDLDLDVIHGTTERGQIDLGGAEWGQYVLDAVQDILISNKNANLSSCSLYSFRAFPRSALVDVRLDRLDDRYGSPTMEDVEIFSREFNSRMESASRDSIVPEELSIEVSSPGANRKVYVPEDLERFRQVPMDVTFRQGEELCHHAFDLVDFLPQERCTIWKLADVKANRRSGAKGKPMNKKEREARWRLGFEDLVEVKLHVDV